MGLHAQFNMVRQLNSVIYASVYQLIPYERTQDQFKNEYAIPINCWNIS